MYQVREVLKREGTVESSFRYVARITLMEKVMLSDPTSVTQCLSRRNGLNCVVR